jgi:hypothetical protein
LALIAGTASNATVEVGITYTNPNGETTLSTVADVTTTPTEQGQVQFPPGQSNASGYNVYAGAVGGPYYLQNTSPVAMGNPYTIPYPLVTATATPPSTNTAIGAGTGGALLMQLYPAAMIGQVNIYYRARPLLYADTTANSWTNLDTSAQEAAVIYAVMRVLQYRGRSAEAKDIWAPQYKELTEDLKESLNRRTIPKSGVVRDVANRSFPSAPWWISG